MECALTLLLLAAGQSSPDRQSVPLNPVLAGLPDNAWVKLPASKEKPVCRSGSPWMPVAPEAGVAFVWGAIHSGSTNDLWTYDAARNVWRELHKTEPSAANDPGLLKRKDGVVMTRAERPLAGHQWGQMDYDSDRHALWYATCLLWQGVYDIRTQAKVTEEGPPRTGLKGPVLWKFDLKTNAWSWVHTEDPAGLFSTYGAATGTFRYFPPLRKFVMVMAARGDSNVFRLFDPDTRRWEPLKVSGKPTLVFGCAPMVYDSKRQVFLINNTRGRSGTHVLDPVRKTIEEIVPVATTPFGNLDGNCGLHAYDSANGTMLTVYTKSNFEVYGAVEDFKKKGWSDPESSVWALDVARKEWVLQPPPTNGVRPTRARGSVQHGYYDAAQNAFFVYEGSYNGPDGELWAYRYKRPRVTK